ncbi:auxin-responsive protein SAUR61-like [Salvia splendens]|uniref:auxin-responsive protein SAUR61-like n=1 Tax=Salvia splendens TaxID=180675 RepID=UPI001C26536E|nr:auxin-responsive protein SAUR61-like [Salvia splendens]XP_042035427.1 auxin-responsive protein SAUR61-like [Salvia splendens]
MDGNGESKITSIGQIVRFKAFLKKWQLVALTPKSCATMPSKGGACAATSPKISLRLRNSNLHCESDDESGHSLEMPSDVPKGYLAVYVGPELRRFIIPTSYLGDPLFKVLLEKVEEEFGFDHSGGLTIPCDIETFKYLQQCMENHRKEQACPSNSATGDTSSPDLEE